MPCSHGPLFSSLGTESLLVRGCNVCFRPGGVSVNVHSAGQNKLLRGCTVVRLDPRLPEMGNRDDCAVIQVKSRCVSRSQYIKLAYFHRVWNVSGASSSDWRGRILVVLHEELSTRDLSNWRTTRAHHQNAIESCPRLLFSVPSYVCAEEVDSRWLDDASCKQLQETRCGSRLRE
jgi:hypothetical protein